MRGWMRIMVVVCRKEGRKEERTRDKEIHKTWKEDILLGDAEFI